MMTRHWQIATRLLGVAFMALAPTADAWGQPCLEPLQGLVGWWPANGNAEDLAGVNDGVLQNGTTFVPDIVGQSFHFDGLNDRVRIADPTGGELDFGASQSFSYMVWVRTSMAANSEVIEKQTDPNNANLPFYQMSILPDGTLSCGIGNGGIIVQFGGTSTINDGSFHHCACVRDVATDSLVLYVDGVAQARRRDTTTGAFASSADLLLGGPRDLATRNFAGSLDEVLVFGRALAASEVRAIYEAGSSGFCGPSGMVTGRVFAECPAPSTGLLGVTVDAFSTLTGELIGTSTTDAAGTYEIANLPPGDYTVTIVLPLGYFVTSAETPVSIVANESESADYSLSCSVAQSNPRGVGFWKHQVGVGLGGPGRAQVSDAELCGSLDTIHRHFGTNALNEVNLYAVQEDATCMEKLAGAAELLNVRGSADDYDRARQQLMTLLLNVAAGDLSLWTVVSVDGATLTQAITYCDNILDASAGDYRLARAIASAINSGEVLDAGLIPLETASIAYKTGSASSPIAFSLEQNTPNPFNPETRIVMVLPVRGDFEIVIYDVAGRAVRRFPGFGGPGPVTVTWDGANEHGVQVSSGIYFYQGRAGMFQERRKMLMLE